MRATELVHDWEQNKTKSTKRKKFKHLKNKSWTEEEVNVFVSVLALNEEMDTP